jgi:hypothetical protein
MKPIAAALALLAILAPCPASASPLMEKVREMLKGEAVKKQQKFNSYPNAKDLRRQLDAICAPIEQAIAQVHAKAFCAAGCANSHDGYLVALRQLHDETRRRLEPNFLRDMRACFTESISNDRDAASFAIATMIGHADAKAEDWGAATWAASSLALGKGVPASKPHALKALQRIASDALPPESKSLLMQMALSLYK